jgi:hypothetical protein
MPLTFLSSFGLVLHVFARWLYVQSRTPNMKPTEGQILFSTFWTPGEQQHTTDGVVLASST